MRSNHIRYIAVCSLTTSLLATFGIVLMLSSTSGADEEATKSRLESLSVTEREELRRKSEDFAKLDQSEQDRMRQLHVAINSSEDSAQLQSVMLNYHEWLKTLAANQRSELLKLPADERIDQIKQLMEEQRQQRFRDLVRTQLPAEDVRAIFGWLDQYSLNHQDELLELLPETSRQRIQQSRASPSMQRKMMMMALGSRGDEVQLPAPTDEEFEKLNETLSGNAQKALAELPSRAEKMKLVREWVRAGVASRMTPQISRERLMEFYREYRERTTDKKRVEELDSLPPEKFYEEVTKMYFRSRGHWRHWRDGDHRGGPRGGWDGRDRDGRDRDRNGDGRGRDGQRGPDSRGPNDDRRRPPGGDRPNGPGERPGDFGPGPPGPPPTDGAGSRPIERLGDAIRERRENGPRFLPGNAPIEN